MKSAHTVLIDLSDFISFGKGRFQYVGLTYSVIVSIVSRKIVDVRSVYFLVKLQSLFDKVFYSL